VRLDEKGWSGVHQTSEVSPSTPPSASIAEGKSNALPMLTTLGWKPCCAARGIAMVPEGRQLFPSLSVEENLIIGGQMGRKGPWSLDKVFALFPILQERRAVASTALSGGQQQMVAIGRALMSNPGLLLLDEISLGLAPVVIKTIYDALPGIIGEGMSAVIVEQDIAKAISVSQRLYCLQEGRVSLEGASATTPRDAIAQAYFGM
jgi:branched-chain amino acid transport system ATP-binding protein